ncbi:unnamed protein product (macronuclear) [Paramecium tetraurelia]|uniref:Uncharacterized protein n=1 Tax=Paramecium tetraurelia TaxID=5888 RepID=A0DXK9_PARTE|nr:uncharacterized protein GSPATT00021400001 [Paramecium tetraurelia]CAK87776.1 unnamed protein product [Paramecium tetraurelia]|eukprot:XP_001455173.1 hypothetical protein (macronuclear) [Paramecium tetraurelia strain d4-2]
MNKNKESGKQVQNIKVNDSNSNKNKELQKLVQNNKHFEFLSSGKIKCLLTHHEILPTLQEFNNYLNGKSYKNAVENDIDFTQFEPYIVQHKTDKNKLFCNLTRQNISKKKSVVLKHVNGKRYKYYLSKYLEEQAKEEQENQQENQEDEGQNELEELNNLVNEAEQQEQPQKQKNGILKGGKKINKKKFKQQKEEKIEVEEEIQSKQKKQQQDGKQVKKLKNKQQNAQVE